MRISPPEAFSDDVLKTFARIEAGFGFVPNSLKAMARKPAILDGFLVMARAVMQPSERLPLSLKQMIAYVASLSGGCRYCQAHTADQSHRHGVDAEKLAALWQFETHPAFNEAERAALRLAMLAAQSPNLAEDSDFVAAKAFYTEDDLTEIVAVIAYFGFLNRWNDTLATPLEDAPLAFAEGALADSGWSIGKHAVR